MSNKQISKLEETLNKLFSGSEYNMVDVSAKAVTARRALDTGEIVLSKSIIELIKNKKMPGGIYLAVECYSSILAAPFVMFCLV